MKKRLTGDDPDVARVAGKLAGLHPRYVALIWVGIRADGTYDHGVATPPGLLGDLVEKVGDVLRGLLKEVRARAARN